MSFIKKFYRFQISQKKALASLVATVNGNVFGLVRHLKLVFVVGWVNSLELCSRVTASELLANESYNGVRH